MKIKLNDFVIITKGFGKGSMGKVLALSSRPGFALLAFREDQNVSDGWWNLNSLVQVASLPKKPKE